MADCLDPNGKHTSGLKPIFFFRHMRPDAKASGYLIVAQLRQRGLLIMGWKGSHDEVCGSEAGD